MITVIETHNASIHAKFNCNKHKQKLIIHALLSCGEMNFDIMASILEISAAKLKEVYKGVCYFNSEQALKLIHLFLIRFTDDLVFT